MDRKGFAKFGLSFALFVAIFFIIFYASTVSADGITEGLNITLVFPTSPLDYYNSDVVAFNYTPVWNDTVSIDNCTLYGNFTGVWSANVSNQSEITNATYNVLTTDLDEGAYEWNVYCYDATGFYDFATPNATVVIDTDCPDGVSINMSVVSSYSPTTRSVFNVTWSDNVAISPSDVYIEGNWSGVPYNYTSADGLYSPETDVFTFNDTLPAGSFYWRSWAMDLAGNWNATTIVEFSVSTADNPVYLFLNGTANANESYTYPEIINATAITAVGSVNLYRDGSSVGSSEEVLLGTGMYAYIVNSTSGNANYSDNTTGIVFFASVSQGTPVLNIFMDELPGNSSVTYPASVVLRGNSTTTLTPPTFNLYLNGLTQTGNPATITTTQGVGIYNLMYNTSGNANWTTAYNNTLFLIVSQNTTNPVILMLNDTEGNNTYSYPEVINATAFAAYPDSGTVSLYRDGAVVGGTSEEALLGNGTYYYKANITGNANYTSNNTGVTFFAFVNKGPTEIILYLNGSVWSTDQNLEYPYPTNINATVNVTGLIAFLEFNGTVVSNPDERLNAVGVYNYTGYYNGSDNNYSTSVTTKILTIDVDSTAPAYAGNVLSTVASYGASNYSNFSVVWTDGTGSVTAYLENNFSGTLENTSMSGTYPYFYYNSTILGTGPYQYRFVANDTNGNGNATPISTFTIVQGVPTVFLYFNGTANANKTDYGYSEAINVTAYSPEGSVTLYNWNDTDVGSSEETTLPLGTYAYKANATGSGNYSDNSTGVTFYLTVGKGNPRSYLNIYIDGTAGNGTIAYPSTANVSANNSMSGDDDCNFTLWRDGVIQANGSAVWNATKLGYGIYKIQYNLTEECTNWSLNGTTAYLHVNKGTPVLDVVVDGVGLDKSVTYPTSTNTTGYESNSDDSDCNYTLYRNGEVLDTVNGTIGYISNVQTLAANTYNYVYNLTTCSNWSSGSWERTVTVSEDSGSTGTGSSGGISTTSTVATPVIRLTKDNVNITLTSLTTSGKMIANIAKYEGVAIRGINVTVVNNVAGVKLVIKKLNSLPTTVSYDVDARVYNYINIDISNITDSDIDKVWMRFAVNKTWLSDNGVGDANITLYRWSGSSWADMEAVKVGEDDSEVFYNAECPGLSIFAIGTTGGAPIIETPEEQTVEETTEETPEQTTEGEPLSTPVIMPDFTITFIIILVIATALSFVIFLKRETITAKLRKSTKNNSSAYSNDKIKVIVC